MKICKLINAVQYVSHQLFEEDAGRYPDLAAELAGDRLGQLPDIRIVTQPGDASR
jgi:hypothetical protein